MPGSGLLVARTRLQISQGYAGALSSHGDAQVVLSIIIQGMYAGEVGIPRLLKLFRKYDIKATWFIPGAYQPISSTLVGFMEILTIERRSHPRDFSYRDGCNQGCWT